MNYADKLGRKTFFVKGLDGMKRPKNGGSTGVFCNTYDDQGNRNLPQMITAFGGTRGGRDPAQKLCEMLNETIDKFHKEG